MTQHRDRLHLNLDPTVSALMIPTPHCAEVIPILTQRRCEAGEIALRTSSGVVAHVWRAGSRQARLARLLGSGMVDERPLDPIAARRVGLLAGEVGATDVVDGHVASSR